MFSSCYKSGWLTLVNSISFASLSYLVILQKQNDQSLYTSTSKINHNKISRKTKVDVSTFQNTIKPFEKQGDLQERKGQGAKEKLFLERSEF